MNNRINCCHRLIDSQNITRNIKELKAKNVKIKTFSKRRNWLRTYSAQEKPA